MFDDLFFSEHEKENPTIFLENENKIFYWNMKNGNLSLSDINRDGKNFEISKNDILKNSTRMKVSREPYGRINLSVFASWIQKVYGFIDIFPMMARRFNLNYINSFTDISSSFKNILRNGYSVIYKKINQINPNKGGVLNNYSLVSGAVKIANQGKEKFINFRRFYYDGNFVLNWEYHQKRTENVEISLIDKKYSRCKNVSIKLNAIQLSKDYPHWRGYENYLIDDKVLFGGYVYKCINAHHSGANFSEENWERSEKIPDALSDDHASSFFSTPRGKFSLRYALQKVAALMNYSRRFVTINFHLDANKFWDITVNDQITFSDLFSNKKITAKVIQTKLVCEEQRRIMQISAGYSPNYSDNIWEKIRNYEIDIADDSGKVEMNDIVKEIFVENPPEVQEKFLTSQNFQSISEAKSVLKNHPTKIKVKLHPLNRKREIVRKIKLKNLEV